MRISMTLHDTKYRSTAEATEVVKQLFGTPPRLIEIQDMQVTERTYNGVPYLLDWNLEVHV